MLFLFESRDDVASEGVKVDAESELEFILCELASPPIPSHFPNDLMVSLFTNGCIIEMHLL